MTTVIIGAGVTGLATAYELAKQGVPVEVFEARSEEGGLGATYVRGQFSFDYGPHEFCTSNPELIQRLEEICGKDLMVITKRTAQFLNHRLISYPFTISAIAHVRPWLALRVAAEIGWSRCVRLFRKPEAKTFAEWTRMRFGPTLYDTYFGPYTKKVWGIDPSELDASTARERISVDTLRQLIMKTIGWGKGRRKRTHDEFPKEFFYFRGGNQTLISHLRSKVESLGGKVHFNKRLQRIDRHEGKMTKLAFEDGDEVCDFKHVVSTIPLPQLIRLIHPEKSDDIIRSHGVRFRGMAFLFLRVNRRSITDRHWIYFPGQNIPFQRWTEFKHFDEAMSPENQTGIALEISMDPMEEKWKLEDGVLADECIESLVSLGFLEREEVLGFDVVRRTHAYPLQIQGFLENTEALLNSVEGIEGLVPLGRQGLFRYCNQDECMEMAIAVAPGIAAGEPFVSYRSAARWRGAGVRSEDSNG